MKILQINSVYGQGSTGKIVKDIHNQLLENKIDSYVIYGRGKVSNDNNIYKISNLFDFGLDLISTRLLNRHGEMNILNTKRVIKKIKAVQPDLIHLHNIHGYYLNYKMLFDYLKSEKIPVIWLMHDQWAVSGNSAYFDEHITKFNKKHRQSIRNNAKEYPKTFHRTTKSVQRVIRKKEESFSLDNLIIVTPSLWLKKSLEETFLKNKNIIMIHNGIKLDSFFPNKLIRPSKKKIILGVASVWDNRKGIEFFINLAKDLNEDYKIILIGVDDKLKKKLPKKIKAINKTESIEKLREMYDLADVLINPTLQDNFPTVNIEAQACGTPVITFNTGGSPESIIDNVTGKIVEKGNYKQLLEDVRKWPKKNEYIKNECVKNSRKYSSEEMVNTYMEMYGLISKENKWKDN